MDNLPASLKGCFFIFSFITPSSTDLILVCVKWQKAATSLSSRERQAARSQTTKDRSRMVRSSQQVGAVRFKVFILLQHIGNGLIAEVDGWQVIDIGAFKSGEMMRLVGKHQ